jgi:N-hydroxyarylamine O-acetyltransferase
MAGGVMRVLRGDAVIGNHLILRVDLDQPYLADVGFGDGLIEPIPLKAGTVRQRHFAFSLEECEPGWWRFHDQSQSGATSFDFQLAPADPALLDERCAFLQTSPESGFVLNAVVQRHLPDGRFAMMRGKVLTLTGAGATKREIGSAREYVETLAASSRSICPKQPPSGRRSKPATAPYPTPTNPARRVADASLRAWTQLYARR